MKKLYAVEIHNIQRYFVEAESQEEAEIAGLDAFASEMPHVESFPIAPCQIDGKCPCPLKSCSACMKGE